jgi:hypothetical protein
VISTEQFDRVLKTDVYAMFWLCKPDHAAAKGAVGNFTRAGAAMPSRGRS